MKRIAVLALTALFFLPLESNADKAHRLNKKGIQSYQNKKFDESIQAFTDALVERPQSPELKFNRGTALSASGEKKEALDELTKAAGTFKETDRAAAAHFNAGNALLQEKDLRNAIEEYKKAVKLDQTSKDIRANLELALRQLKEQQKQQQKQQQDKNQQNKDKNKDQNKDKNQNSNKEKDKKDKDQDKNTKNDQNDRKKDDDQQQQQQQPQPQDAQEKKQQQMTPEEAKRLLDAINNEEKRAFSLLREKARNTVRQDDDW